MHPTHYLVQAQIQIQTKYHTLLNANVHPPLILDSPLSVLIIFNVVIAQYQFLNRIFNRWLFWCFRVWLFRPSFPTQG